LSRIASLESGPKPDATRNLSAGIDPATFKEEANQTTEDQIGLNKGQRRDVQRRLTGLGFDTKATGQFDQSTRAVITRWQAARGYPNSGYLNKLQHKALLTEIVAVAPTASTDEERPKRRAPSTVQAQPQPQQAPPQRQYSAPAPGPDPAGAGRFIGGVVGGMLR
jgi:peptidoglycan hydrolase-like protein with peptidoglycan-binding domain